MEEKNDTRHTELVSGPTIDIKSRRPWNKSRVKNIIGFTLVELIVVITILVILGTIAFTSLTWFQSWARDGVRTSDIVSIRKGLDIFQIASGTYPLPEGNLVYTGSIGGVTYSYLGEIGDSITRIAKVSKTPRDPISDNRYVYWVTANQKEYQIAASLENTNYAYNAPITPLIIPQVFADGTYSARVDGNYRGYMKFASGSETWIANIPSLIFAGSGSINLLSSGTYFVVNRNTNLPYKVTSDTITQNKNANAIIQELTKSTIATLTGVNITSVTKDTFASVFTGATLASFSISGNGATDTVWTLAFVEQAVFGSASAKVSAAPSGCSLSGTSVAHGASITAYSENSIVWNAAYDCTGRQMSRTCNNGVLDGSGTYQYSSCVKGTPNTCSASGSYVYNTHTYSIPELNHASGATSILSSVVNENNGTFKYTLASVTCNDGVLVSPSESGGPTVQSCNGGYGINGNICSLSQAGTCNNTVALGCIVGSAISDGWQVSCGTTRTWNCSGLYGGGNSVQCSVANASCCTPSGSYSYGSCSVSWACWQFWTKPKYDSCGSYAWSIACDTGVCAWCAAHTRTCVPSWAPAWAYCSANIPALASWVYRGWWQWSWYVDTVWNYPSLPSPKYNYCWISVTCNNWVITQNVCTW